MRLFQLKNSDDENIGLYSVEDNDPRDEAEISTIIYQNWTDDDALELEDIKRVFVTEIYF
jgi:hypothetical protein